MHTTQNRQTLDGYVIQNYYTQKCVIINKHRGWHVIRSDYRNISNKISKYKGASSKNNTEKSTTFKINTEKEMPIQKECMLL